VVEAKENIIGIIGEKFDRDNTHAKNVEDSAGRLDE